MQYLQNSDYTPDRDNEIRTWNGKIELTAQYSNQTSKFPHTVTIERELNKKKAEIEKKKLK